jgi:hypothetical protein
LDAQDTQAISVFLETVKDMSGVFNQMFPLVTNTKGIQPPANVFCVIGHRLIQSNVLKTDSNPTPAVNSPTPAPNSPTVKGARKSPTPATAACQGSKSAVKIEPKESNGQKYKLYSLVFSDCKNPNSGVVLANWTIGAGGDSNMNFNVGALNAFPNDAYGQLSDYSQKIGSSCSAHYDLDKKEVRSFSCKNLSQDYKLANEANANKGIYFKTIDFDRTAAKPLKVLAELIDMSKVPWTSLKVVAEDDPSLNEFKVETYPPITGSDDGSAENANADVKDGQLQPPPPPTVDTPADGTKADEGAKDTSPAGKENESKTGDTANGLKPDTTASVAHQPADSNAKSSQDGDAQQNPQAPDSHSKQPSGQQPGQQPNVNPQDPAGAATSSEGANPPPQGMT